MVKFAFWTLSLVFAVTYLFMKIFFKVDIPQAFYTMMLTFSSSFLLIGFAYFIVEQSCSARQ
jgi:hypothetical protein